MNHLRTKINDMQIEIPRISNLQQVRVDAERDKKVIVAWDGCRLSTA